MNRKGIFTSKIITILYRINHICQRAAASISPGTKKDLTRFNFCTIAQAVPRNRMTVSIIFYGLIAAADRDRLQEGLEEWCRIALIDTPDLILPAGGVRVKALISRCFIFFSISKG